MYQIRKGWPSQGAIDEVLMAKPGETITDGMVAAIDTATGKLIPANYTGAAADTDPMPAFIIGVERVKGTITGIMSQCVIEVDASHYEADTYAIGDFLTAKAGKFAKAGSSKAIGRVMQFDATSGLMRLMWHESR